ncbi:MULTISPECIES: DUF4148 domain-containing protein [Burkholderia]|uniref:DUF4148 domain-containing protein n=1 Tax=Burkholderia vietnamiensis (strain G4 / LMG 22486) TaxID=269482 RepID=A4JK75_BURVG|nr:MULTISPECIES: DUF4148 domain-containing protein [Burkholderia]ABO56678.1 conserved hypothetical protein [Burkholderia vietnamiensis G4]AOJ99357.1 hypothetical protein WK23_12360 [Burkholderia vietnamiensis]KVE66648.1 hypothetical protein WI96_00385 [Burkholderia vietnamiensis]KVF06204.1 hypothetical protein WJ05_25510 [Burkholderia vietnamiensis]KVS24312.1 hypothetical protein WK34_17335 [Burkholderia vietnamiensis]
MKRLFPAIVIAVAASAPLAAQAQAEVQAQAQAQSNPPLTRAQVRAEVKALKQAGFQPSDWFYPASIVSAEAKIAREQHAGYGSDGSPSSETSH